MSPVRSALVLAFLAVLVHSASIAGEAVTLKDAPGRKFVASNCILCHSLDYIVMNGPLMTPSRWESSVRKMMETMGAPIDPKVAEQILQYLSTQYVEASPRG